MGWNTTVIIYNDALHNIAEDKEFGKNLSDAVLKMGCYGQKMVDIPSGCHCNAAVVVESHHADQTAVVAVGGNAGTVWANVFGWEHNSPALQARALEAMADKMGYKIVRKPLDQKAMTELKESWSRGVAGSDIDLTDISTSVSHAQYKRVLSEARKTAKQSGRRVVTKDGSVEDYGAHA